MPKTEPKPLTPEAQQRLACLLEPHELAELNSTIEEALEAGRGYAVITLEFSAHRLTDTAGRFTRKVRADQYSLGKGRTGKD